MRYIGIDPGLSGAISWILEEPEGVSTGFMDMPIKDCFLDPQALLDLLSGDPVAAICIEQVGAMGTDGRSSLSRFMEIFGGIKAIALLSGHPLTFIRPLDWKKALGLVVVTPKGQAVKLTPQERAIKKKLAKEASMSLAKGLYPDSSGFLTRKKDHDRAEALLLAHYLRIKNVY